MMDDRPKDFAEQANAPQPGFLAELWEFMAANRKWWLAPIVAMLLLIGGLILMSGTAVAPFVYTLF